MSKEGMLFYSRVYSLLAGAQPDVFEELWKQRGTITLGISARQYFPERQAVRIVGLNRVFPGGFDAGDFWRQTATFFRQRAMSFGAGGAFPLNGINERLVTEAADLGLLNAKNELVFRGALLSGFEPTPEKATWFCVGDDEEFLKVYAAEALKQVSVSNYRIGTFSTQKRLTLIRSGIVASYADESTHTVLDTLPQTSLVRASFQNSTTVSHQPLEQAPVIGGPRRTAASLRFGVDGMTLNIVGELITDEPRTRPYRHQCRRIYLRALQDFTTALVYGHRCVTVGSLPTPHGQGKSPGEELVALCGKEFFETIPISGMGPPSDLIQTQRAIIEGDLKGMDQWKHEGPDVARAVMLREASLYLGEHESLHDDEPPYVFNIDRPFFEDPELQKAISPRVVSELVGAVDRVFDGPSKRALWEFTTRFLLTHITIGRWYQLPAFGCWRIPFATRAYASINNCDAKLDPVAQLRLTLADTILSDLPATCIGQGRSRALAWIVDQARDACHDPVRIKLTELDQALGANVSEHEVRRLCSAIARMAPRAAAGLLHQVFSTENAPQLILVREGRKDLSVLFEIFPEVCP